jgi:hypothetical protein
MRAASFVPSFSGIKVCSMTRTGLGKFVTITAHHSCWRRLVGVPQQRKPVKDAVLYAPIY